MPIPSVTDPPSNHPHLCLALLEWRIRSASENAAYAAIIDVSTETTIRPYE